jgi:hypothetical protein
MLRLRTVSTIHLQAAPIKPPSRSASPSSFNKRPNSVAEVT